LPDKSRIVEEGNYHKFTKSKESEQMLKALMATGDRELVEVCCDSTLSEEDRLTDWFQASPTDRIWGVGYGAADAEANRANWGENRLGKAIMVVREQLKREGH